jgi:hypothetical protein
MHVGDGSPSDADGMPEVAPTAWFLLLSGQARRTELLDRKDLRRGTSARLIRGFVRSIGARP